MFGRVASVATLVLVLAGTAAGQTLLQSLDTGEAAAGWEAVGRLDIEGKGFCTGTLIAPDLVLTAAHCLFDRTTGERVDATRIEFQAGLRNGRAEAYRDVRRAVIPAGYRFTGLADASGRREEASQDVALLELAQPIRLAGIAPIATAADVGPGATVGVVSYAHDRAEAPSLQEACDVIAEEEGVLFVSCDVDFGSSGAPIFTMVEGKPQIVSVVFAKAMLDDRPIALGTQLSGPLQEMQTELSAGGGAFRGAEPGAVRVIGGGERAETGAKFVRP